jgi:hypothetical protein
MAIVAQLGQIPVTASYNEKGAIVYNFQADTPVPARPDIRPLTAAVRYITQFGDTGQAAYTWSQSQVGEPADAFVGEKLAMYIGYSGEFKSLKARNPRADFQISVFPQSQELNSFTTGMRMYAFATLRTAKNPDTARVAQSAFASVALSPDISAAIGALPPFRSYAGMPSLDPVLARSMVVAKGWYDVYSKDSSLLTSRMVSDIINHREGVTDAVVGVEGVGVGHGRLSRIRRAFANRRSDPISPRLFR